MGAQAVNPDPYASIAKPVGGADPYASIAKPIPAPAPEKKGFFQSAYEASPLPIAVAVATHPIESAKNVAGAFGIGTENQDNNPILQTIGHEVDRVKTAAKLAWNTPNNQPMKAIDRTLYALPGVGGILQTADEQHAAGNDRGAAGTVAGLLLSAEAIRGGTQLLKKIPGAVGKAALLGKTPEAAYESALKPSTVLSSAERASAIDTGLKNEIPVSKAGVEKIGSLIDDLNEKIKSTIDADPNRPIDPNAVATRADVAKAKFAKQVNAGGDLQAIEDSKQQFLREQGGATGTPAPPLGAADAQAMKQGTYRVLSGKFGEQGSASVEAQKALARGLKEEIATQFPEIDKMNAAESRLLDLQPILERAVNRISNHQAIGIGTPAAGMAAEAVTGSMGVGRVAMVMKAVLDNPSVKSRLAIAVSKAQKIPISKAMNRVNAYSAGLASTVAAGQANSTSDTTDQPTTQQSPQQ